MSSATEIIDVKRTFRCWMMVLALMALGVPQLEAQASMVVLARHAEKSGTSDTASLTAAGHQRASDLAKALAATRLDAIISTQYTRTRQTAAPAAKQARLEVTVVEGGNGVAANAEAVARAIDSLAPGSAVLVVGHSNTLTPIIAAMGGPQLPELCDLEYSTLFVLERPAPAASWRLLRSRYGASDPPGADQCHGTDQSMPQAD